jgi:hypothetical protein
MEVQESELNHRHELKKAVRTLGNVITLVRRGYDFTTEEGQAILAEADGFREWLEQELALQH